MFTLPRFYQVLNEQRRRKFIESLAVLTVIRLNRIQVLLDKVNLSLWGQPQAAYFTIFWHQSKLLTFNYFPSFGPNYATALILNTHLSSRFWRGKKHVDQTNGP